MNHCFETGDFPESTRMTVTEVHSMTKEAFENATHEPTRKHSVKKI